MIPAKTLLFSGLLFIGLFAAFKKGGDGKTGGCMDWNKDELYAGESNQIWISVPGKEPENLNVSVKGGGRISCDANTDGKPRFYRVTPDTNGKNITIIVRIKNNDSIYCERTYKVVKKIKPKVLIYFGDYQDTIPLSQVMKVDKIVAKEQVGKLSRPKRYLVRYYVMVVNPQRGPHYTSPYFGNNVNDNMKERLKTLIPGDQILIQDVQVEGPTGKFNAGGLKLTVK